MKKTLFSVISVFLILCSCSNNDDDLNFAGTGRWWYIDCIEANNGSGTFTIIGSLDYGRFFFHANGKYSRRLDSVALAFCQNPDRYIIHPNGFGVPFGDVTNGENDSTWTINGSTINISKYGSWEIVDQSASQIVIQSSRTDYEYSYTLITK